MIYQRAPVAQLAECQSYELAVVGSIPAGSTSFFLIRFHLVEKSVFTCECQILRPKVQKTTRATRPPPLLVLCFKIAILTAGAPDMCDAEFIRTRKEYVVASHMLLFDEDQHRAIKRRKTSRKDVPKFARSIERCILCLYPATFQDKPTATTVAVFVEWVDSISHCPRTRKKLLKRMEPLNLHPDLAACIPPRPSAEDKTEMHRIFQAMDGTGAQMTQRTCEAHLAQLRRLSPDHPLSFIGDIAFNDAVHFCTARGTLHPGRDAILGATGFRHGDRLMVTLLRIPSLLKRFSTIRKTLPKNSKYSVKKYISLFLAFDARLLCLSSMTCEEVLSVVLTIIDAPATAFNMIRAELQDQHCDTTISFLESTLPSKYTGITAVDRLGSSCSQWCNEMVGRSSRQNSSHG
jgi:hypothetical protein